ncbi:MAG: DNA mismatch repair protein MutS, partial [Lysobacteraceae bacterium]
LIKLDKWQKKYNTHIIKSFDLMAEFEALISISILSYNHPSWVLPMIKDEFGFIANDLGHPLITESKRVNNSFQLQQHATVDVITGSNMAGKSTFLRTIGINMVLAFAGAKVCADHFETSVFNLLSTKFYN